MRFPKFAHPYAPTSIILCGVQSRLPDPAVKQRELERIAKLIFDEFREATGRRKGARTSKIILIGSHARGDYVDASLSANQYKR